MVLTSKIDFAAMEQLGLFDKSIRTFVAKKIKELLGVEELVMIKLVVDHLRQGQATPESLTQKISQILEEETEDFVYKLW